MDEDFADLAVGLMMAAFALLGLFLAAGANDDEMSVFGFSLVAFSWIFIMGLVKRHYDRRAPVLAAARAGKHV